MAHDPWRRLAPEVDRRGTPWGSALCAALLLAVATVTAASRRPA
ncbi:hypothetical protein [Streptomyces sp. NPDC047718]